MTGNRSIFRFLMTLVFAALIASPQPMVAQDGVSDTGNAAIDSSSPEAGDGEAGDTGTGDGEAGDTGTGDAESGDTGTGDGEAGDTGTGDAESGDPGTGDAEAGDTGAVDDGEAGDTGTGDAEAGDGFEGSSSTSNDDGFTIQQQVNHCDFTQKPSSTSWADWFEGTDPCLVVVNNQPEACGVVDFSLINNLVNFPAAVTHRIFWSEGPYAWNNRNDFPHQFAEDYNGGSVDIHVAYVTNERDYINGMGAAGHDIYNYYSVVNGGVVFTIDTDCEPNIPTPEENPDYYCETRPTSGSVATWLQNAPDGYNTDCLNVGIPVQACGTLEIPYENLTSYNSALYWNVGDAPNSDTAQPLPITAGTFAEDEGGGEVVVTVWIGHPESDYYAFIGEADQPYTWNTVLGTAGVQFTIDTDCEDPEPVNYCEYPGSHIGGVYNWLDNATREGNETDCIDVGEPVQACGSLDIPFESRITGFNSEYTLYWAVGSEIPGDDSLWNTTWPIEFDEDEFGGSVDVIVFVGGPEDDYYHFADIDPYPYPYPNTPQGGHDARSLGGGVEYTVLTDCEDPIPVNFCDYSQHTGAGDVYSWLAGAPEGSETDCIDVGTPVQVCGSLDIPFESRITGFQSEYTLYWAVGTEIPDDDSQWNTTWPIEFDEDENGGSVDVIVFIGGPEDDYYHFADEDPYPYPYPNQDRGDIPARSLGGGVQYTVLTDCDLEPAVLELPTVTLSVCDDAYQATPIVVIAPENSDSVTYSNVTAVSGPAGLTFTITATVNHGFTFEGITPPEGWTVVDNGLATYSVTLALADCEVPLKVATPELPTLVAAMCDDDNEPVLPTLTVPETEGITYGEVTVGPANSVLLSLTATANEGYTFAGATLPEGWTLVNSSEAVYEIIAEEAECPTPDPTETPTPEPTQPATPEPTETPKPEDPKEKDPEVTELPTTGTGSNPASMIGLAATAAAAIAGAGLFFTNRKR